MKLRITAVSALLATLVVGLSASGQTGIYGVIERVVREPADGPAERVQIWGAFALIERIAASNYAASTQVDGQFFTNYVYQKPARGYLYFKLPTVGEQIANTRTEWRDLGAVAGTGQAVAFGYADYYRGDKTMRVRAASTPPSDPDIYYTNVGVAKLPAAGAHARIVEELQKLIAK